MAYVKQLMLEISIILQKQSEQLFGHNFYASFGKLVCAVTTALKALTFR